MTQAAYLHLHRTGDLENRIKVLQEGLQSCALCPRDCRVNRLKNEKGFCRTGRWAVVSSCGPHFGEEEPLVGSGGSGTLFFTHCNLGCCFCQNYEISHEGHGREASPEDLAGLMVSLQEQGCHNINFVSPSHVVTQIVEALPLAIGAGLRVPLVYNTGGYDLPETLRILEGIVDIYMPDYKFSLEEAAREFADASDYPKRVRHALVEMHRQVGDLVMDGQGIAERGLLIRHLVLPRDQAGSEECFQWIAEHLSRNTYLNIMKQYRPSGTAHQHAALANKITSDEYREAIQRAKKHGLNRLDSRRRLSFLLR